MSKATASVDTVRSHFVRSNGFAGLSVNQPKGESLARLICGLVYSEGKTDGAFSMSLEAVPRRLYMQRDAVKDGLTAGARLGWFRQGDKRIELTASGIYIAKRVLKLPT
jgi:hypothetical protein